MNTGLENTNEWFNRIYIWPSNNNRPAAPVPDENEKNIIVIRMIRTDNFSGARGSGTGRRKSLQGSSG